MKILLKISVGLLLCVVLCINTLAISGDILTPDSEFVIYTSDKNTVSDILDTTAEELEEKISNQNIIFLAVNRNNTKQIQMTETQNDFSKTVSDFSNLSVNSIITLIPAITGIEDVTGSVVSHDGQKYAYVNLKQEENGYILTQYFTVKDQKLYTVTFYTQSGISLDYIKTAFPTEKHIIGYPAIPNTGYGSIIAITIAIGIFCLIFAYILFTLFRDFKNKNK